MKGYKSIIVGTGLAVSLAFIWKVGAQDINADSLRYYSNTHSINNNHNQEQVIDPTLENIVMPELYDKSIPLERQICQGIQGDCQTVAALKYLALENPDKLLDMVSYDGANYIVTFPKTDLTGASSWISNFDYEKTIVEVSEEDIKSFKKFYGRQTPLIQSLIYCGLIKRMWDREKYPLIFKDDAYLQNPEKINYSSVAEYASVLADKSTMFLVTSEDAMFVLTGEKYENLSNTLQESTDNKRLLFMKSNESLSIDEVCKIDNYLFLMLALLEKKKLVCASQSNTYFSSDGQVCEFNDFKKSLGDYLFNTLSEFDLNDDGIVEGHAYSLFPVYKNHVRMHNPWNFYEPQDNGDNQDDGIFKISLSKLLSTFTSFIVKYDAETETIVSQYKLNNNTLAGTTTPSVNTAASSY